MLGVVVGRRNVTRRRIERETGARIQMLPPAAGSESANWTCRVTGSQDKTQMAATMIQDLIDHSEVHIDWLIDWRLSISLIIIFIFSYSHIQKYGKPNVANGHISAMRRPIHFLFGSRVGFSRSTDRTALFPVGSNSRWRRICEYEYQTNLTDVIDWLIDRDDQVV